MWHVCTEHSRALAECTREQPSASAAGAARRGRAGPAAHSLLPPPPPARGTPSGRAPAGRRSK